MILAINTASENVSIALFQPKKIQPRRLDSVLGKEISWKSYKTQSKELLPKIDKFLNKNKIKLQDLQAIVVFQGPGSYTGLRVGISVANSLAWSLDISVIGIIQNAKIKMQSQNAKSKIFQKKMINYPRALEIAKKSEKILRTLKKKEFSKIVVPYYSSSIK